MRFYPAVVDSKGRMKLPEELLSQVEHLKILILWPCELPRFLVLMFPEVSQPIIDRFIEAEVSFKKTGRATHYGLNRQVDGLSFGLIDDEGRVHLPIGFLKRAAINERIVIISHEGVWEIWSEERWKREAGVIGVGLSEEQVAHLRSLIFPMLYKDPFMTGAIFVSKVTRQRINVPSAILPEKILPRESPTLHHKDRVLLIVNYFWSINFKGGGDKTIPEIAELTLVPYLQVLILPDVFNLVFSLRGSALSTLLRMQAIMEAQRYCAASKIEANGALWIPKRLLEFLGILQTAAIELQPREDWKFNYCLRIRSLDEMALGGTDRNSDSYPFIVSFLALAAQALGTESNTRHTMLYKRITKSENGCQIINVSIPREIWKSILTSSKSRGGWQRRHVNEFDNWYKEKASNYYFKDLLVSVALQMLNGSGPIRSRDLHGDSLNIGMRQKLPSRGLKKSSS
jgi:DNA-binding transcriptional regulator/RsmH inhibitor MraZ